MRIFGGDRVKALMYRLGMTEGVPIESKLISRRIENAQKSVEAQNFDARKHLLEYDDVMNKQRETIYGIGRSALEGNDQRERVLGIAEEDRKSTRLNSSHPSISYAVFCLKKKKK